LRQQPPVLEIFKAGAKGPCGTQVSPFDPLSIQYA
jgi:hypothetical protein